jgi:hypothetical protein
MSPGAEREKTMNGGRRIRETDGGDEFDHDIL